MLDPAQIVSANTSVNRGICISDKSQLILTTALGFLEDRSVWADMNDAQWDSLDGDIGDTYGQLLDYGSCSGGGSVNTQIVNVTFGGTEFNTLSQSYVDVDSSIQVDINCSGSGGIVQVTFSFVGFKNTTGSGYYRITDGTISLSEVQITQAIASPVTLVSTFENNVSGIRTFKLQYKSSSANLVRVLNTIGYAIACEIY